MFAIRVDTPTHTNVLGWLDSRDVDDAKLDDVVRSVALDAEGYLKAIIHLDTHEATGQTAASVETWLVHMGDRTVQYAVGSRTRGHILRWLDVGRGWVYPVGRRALWIKKERVTPPIYRAWARPSPALNVMFRAASQALSNMEKTARRVIEK